MTENSTMTCSADTTKAGSNGCSAATDAESKKIKTPADVLHRAEDELNKAKQFCSDMRQEAADRLETVRDKSVGDMIDGTCNMAKNHPGACVAVAMFAGFLLGRKFRW